MRRCSPIGIRLLLVPIALLSLASWRVAEADTTVTITDIGTKLTGEFMIDTHVDSVTYSGPADVVFEGIPAVEIRGTVSGVGWGGGGVVARAANAHYDYNIPFVARWRKQGAAPRLVFYNHGGGATLMIAIKREKLTGTANQHRFAERSGDLLIGVPALLDGATYVAINRRGMRGDGTFSATYQPAVAPLTAGEVDAIKADIASAPGPASFVQPGIAAGAPVPLVPSVDVPTCRDVARALERVIASIQGTQFRTRIGTGGSSGARVFAGFNFGRSGIGGKSVRTGGNNVIPYDTTSPRIFDGFILMGYPYIPDIANADPMQPLSAPVMFVQGQGDERYQQHVTMAHELLKKGVALNDKVWLYEIRNLTHVTRDSVAEITTGSDGDRFGCFIGAALRNLRLHLEEGRSPPLSRMAGRIVNGMLQIDQVRGARTNVAPVVNDPAQDTVVFDPMVIPRPIGSAETARWQEVTAALPHVPDAITPPTVACRLGGYKLMFFGAQLVPCSPAELLARYGSFECYRACVCRTVSCLEAQGLYDPRVESADATAERARGLFRTASVPAARSPQQTVLTIDY
jgi:hypothetical protein